MTQQNRSRIPRRPVHGIQLLDKPLGLSSNQALQEVKRLLRAEKAGHTGSLDPLATGMLPLCFGQATKLCGHLLESDKRYMAMARIGERTATGDAEGEVIARSDATLLTRAALEQAAAKFLGEIEQIPPMYSALKREGRPLYELAREGLVVERAARRVRIDALVLTDFANGSCQFDIRCSKGTYIRTLVEDIAAATGQQAHLTALRRVEVEPFDGHPMHTLDSLEGLAAESMEALDACLLDSLAALRGWPQAAVDVAGAHFLLQGRPIRLPGVAPGPVALTGPDGRLLALGEADAAGLVAPQRWLGTA
jgi:tRNA pseudouridine55 synthase